MYIRSTCSDLWNVNGLHVEAVKTKYFGGHKPNYKSLREREQERERERERERENK